MFFFTYIWPNIAVNAANQFLIQPVGGAVETEVGRGYPSLLVGVCVWGVFIIHPVLKQTAEVSTWAGFAPSPSCYCTGPLTGKHWVVQQEVGRIKVERRGGRAARTNLRDNERGGRSKVSAPTVDINTFQWHSCQWTSRGKINVSNFEILVWTLRGVPVLLAVVRQSESTGAMVSLTI